MNTLKKRKYSEIFENENDDINDEFVENMIANIQPKRQQNSSNYEIETNTSSFFKNVSGFFQKRNELDIETPIKVYLLITTHGTIPINYNQIDFIDKPFYEFFETNVELLRLKATQLHACNFSDYITQTTETNTMIDLVNSNLDLALSDEKSFLENKIIPAYLEIYNIHEGQNFYIEQNLNLDPGEITNLRNSNEKYSIVQTLPSQRIIDKIFLLSDNNSDSESEGIYVCNKITFKYPIKITEDFRNLIDKICKVLNIELNNDKFYIDQNDNLTYQAGVSILTCPYFIAYNIHINNIINQNESKIMHLTRSINDEILSLTRESYPYLKLKNLKTRQDISMSNEGIRKFQEMIIFNSLVKTRASILYSYFHNCDKVISMDRSCEVPSIVSNELKNILTQFPKHELYDKTYRQLKNMRYDAIANNLRGGNKFIKKNKFKRKQKKNITKKIYKLKSKKIIKRKFKRKTKKY